MHLNVNFVSYLELAMMDREERCSVTAELDFAIDYGFRPRFPSVSFSF